MRDTIYTIPVVEAFQQESECPMCILEDNLERKYVDYFIGYSVMDPDTRIETNDKGFCMRHYETMYSERTSRLQLALLLDTFMQAQNTSLKRIFDSCGQKSRIDLRGIIRYPWAKRSCGERKEVDQYIRRIIEELQRQKNECSICNRIKNNMHRYTEIIILLWLREEDFRRIFGEKEGFCQKHFLQLLEVSQKHTSKRQISSFLMELTTMQLQNLERVQKEVNWFTQKFAHHNQDASWGNSKDALKRGIQKVVGVCHLK